MEMVTAWFLAIILCSGVVLSNSELLTILNITPSTITAKWQRKYKSYLASIKSDNSVVKSSVVLADEGKLYCEYTFTGLSPSTKYYLTIIPDVPGAESLQACVRTISFSYHASVSVHNSLDEVIAIKSRLHRPGVLYLEGSEMPDNKVLQANEMQQLNLTLKSDRDLADADFKGAIQLFAVSRKTHLYLDGKGSAYLDVSKAIMDHPIHLKVTSEKSTERKIRGEAGNSVERKRSSLRRKLREKTYMDENFKGIRRNVKRPSSNVASVGYVVSYRNAESNSIGQTDDVLLVRNSIGIGNKVLISTTDKLKIILKNQNSSTNKQPTETIEPATVTTVVSTSTKIEPGTIITTKQTTTKIKTTKQTSTTAEPTNTTTEPTTKIIESSTARSEPTTTTTTKTAEPTTTKTNTTTEPTTKIIESSTARSEPTTTTTTKTAEPTTTKTNTTAEPTATVTVATNITTEPTTKPTTTTTELPNTTTHPTATATTIKLKAGTTESITEKTEPTTTKSDPNTTTTQPAPKPTKEITTSTESTTKTTESTTITKTKPITTTIKPTTTTTESTTTTTEPTPKRIEPTTITTERTPKTTEPITTKTKPTTTTREPLTKTTESTTTTTEPATKTTKSTTTTTEPTPTTTESATTTTESTTITTQPTTTESAATTTKSTTTTTESTTTTTEPTTTTTTTITEPIIKTTKPIITSSNAATTTTKSTNTTKKLTTTTTKPTTTSRKPTTKTTESSTKTTKPTTTTAEPTTTTTKQTTETIESSTTTTETTIVTTESTNTMDVRNLKMLQLNSTSATICWEVGSKHNVFILQLISDDEVRDLIHLGNEYFVMYTIQNILPDTKYMVVVQNSLPNSRPKELTFRTTGETSTVVVEFVNRLSTALIVTWIDFHENSLDLPSFSTDIVTLHYPLENLPPVVKFQVLDIETGLLLVKRYGGFDYVELQPQKFNTDYKFLIHKYDRIEVQRPCYIFLHITNFADTDVTVRVHSISGSIVASKRLQRMENSMQLKIHVSTDVCPYLYTLTAFDRRGDLAVNKKDSLHLYPSFVKTEFPVFVGNRDDIKDLPQTYRMDISVQNKWKNNVLLIWMISDDLHTLSISPGKVERKIITLARDSQPDSLFLKLADQTAERNLKTENEDFQLEVKFTLTPQPVFVKINRNALVSVERTYYLLLNITNTLEHPVVLKYDSKTIQLKPRETVFENLITRAVSQPEDTVFRSFNGVEELVVNDELGFTLHPTLTAQLSHLIIGVYRKGQAERNLAALRVVNPYWKKFTVFMSNATHHSNASVDRISVKDIFLDSPMTTVRCVSQHGHTFYLNGSATVTLKNNHTTLVLTQKPEDFDSKWRVYFYTSYFSNYLPNEVTLKWIERGRPRYMLVPPGVERRFRRVLLERSKPKDLLFYYFDRTARLKMRSKDHVQIPATEYVKNTHIVFDTESISKIHYLNLELINTLPFEVTIVLSEGVGPWLLPAHSYMRKNEKLTVGANADVFLIEAKSGDKSIAINGMKYGVYIAPTRSQNKITLYVGMEELDVMESAKIIQTKVDFVNKVGRSIYVTCERTKVVIPVDETFTYSHTSVEEKLKPPFFSFHDLHTDTPILLREGSWEFPNKVEQRFLQNKYSYKGQVALSSYDKSILYMASLTVHISSEKLVKTLRVNCSEKSQLYMVTPGGYSVTRALHIPMYKPKKIVTLEVGGEGTDIILLNGRKSHSITLSSDHTRVWLSAETQHNLTLKISNLQAEDASLRYVHHKFNEVIHIPHASTMQLIFLPNSQLLDDEGRNLLESASRNQIELKEKSLKENEAFWIDFKNMADVPTVIKRLADNVTSLPDIRLDGDENSRLFFTFPGDLAWITLSAVELRSGLPMTINGQPKIRVFRNNHLFTATIRQYSPGSNVSYSVDVYNTLKIPVTVEWISEGHRESCTIPPNDHTLIFSSYHTMILNPTVTFQSYVDDRRLLVDGKEAFVVQPSQAPKTVFVDLQKDTPSDMKFIHLSVRKKVKEEVLLSWSIGPRGYLTQLVEGSSDLEIHTTSSKPLNLQAYSVDDQAVTLNAFPSLQLQLTKETQNHPIHIQDSHLGVRGTWAELRLINSYPLPVNVEWAMNKRTRLITLQPGEDITLTDHVFVSSHEEHLLSLNAWDVHTKDIVLVNNRTLFRYDPFLQHSFLFLLSSNDVIYCYNAHVNNPTSEHVQLRMHDKQVFTIAPFTQQYVFVGKSDSPRQTFPLQAFDAKGKLVYLNRHMTYNLTYDNGAVTVGNVVSKRYFYYKLRVRNLESKMIVVSWEMNNRKHSRIIAGNYFNYPVVGSVHAKEPPVIMLKAHFYRGRKPLLINDREAFQLPTTLTKLSQPVRVFVSASKTHKNLTVHLKNPTSESIGITWKTLLVQGTTVVPGLQDRYSFQIQTIGAYWNQVMLLEPIAAQNSVFTVNSDKKFIARLPFNRVITLDYLRKDLIFNNTLGVDVTLTLTPGQALYSIPSYTALKLQLPCKNFTDKGITFKAYEFINNKPMLINGNLSLLVKVEDEVKTLIIGDRAKERREFFVSIQLVNNKSSPVILQWDERGSEQYYLVATALNETVILSFFDNQPVFISAMRWPSKEGVYLNNEDRLQFTPSKQAESQFVRLAGEISNYDYYYRLSITNGFDNDVRIEMHEGSTKMKSIIPANVFDFVIEAPLTNMEQGAKQLRQVFAYEDKTDAPLYINEVEWVDSRATLKSKEWTYIWISGEPVPLKLYYYSLLITSPPEVDVIIRYNFPNQPTTRIPKSVVNFSAVFPVKNFRPPGFVEFRAFEESSNVSLLINGKFKGVIAPTTDEKDQQMVVLTNSFEALNAASYLHSGSLSFKMRVENMNPFPITLDCYLNAVKLNYLVQPKDIKYIEQTDNSFGVRRMNCSAQINDIHLLVNGKLKEMVISSTSDSINVLKVTAKSKYLKLTVTNNLAKSVFLKAGKVGLKIPANVESRWYFLVKSENLSFSTDNELTVDVKGHADYTAVKISNAGEVLLQTVNTLDADVYLSWNERQTVIPRGEHNIHLKSLDTQLFAKTIDGLPVYINNQPMFRILSNLKKFTLVLSDKDHLTTTIPFTINNTLNRTTVITCLQLGSENTQVFHVLPRSQFSRSLAFMLPLSMLKLKVAATDKKNRPLIVNDEKAVFHLTKKDTFHIEVRESLERRYTIKLHIVNKDAEQKKLLWDGLKHSLIVPAKSDVTREIELFSVSQPPPIVFRTYSWRNRLGTINGLENIYLQPHLNEVTHYMELK